MGRATWKKRTASKKWAWYKKRCKSKKEETQDEIPDDQRQDVESVDEDPTDRCDVSMCHDITNNKSSIVSETGCTVQTLRKETDFSDSTGSETRPRVAVPTKQPVAQSASFSGNIGSCSKRIGQPIRTYSKRGRTDAGSDSLDLQQAMLELHNTRFDDDIVVPHVVNQQMRDEPCDNDVDELLHDESSSRDSTNVQENDSVNPDGEDTNSGVESDDACDRHVVKIKYVFKKLHEYMDNHDPGCPCSIRDIDLWKQVDRGMRSQLFFRCTKCKFHCSVWTDPEDSYEMSIHEGTVCGTLAAGIGYATMQAQLAAMGIRCLSHVTYNKVRDELAPHVDTASEKEMNDAAEMERTLAIQQGRVTPEGIPFIRVLVDGGWSKRSYRGGRYDALSGTAVIVGELTGRILFCGVRNKYCCVCSRAMKRNEDPPVHICYKNWGRDQPSSSMEKDIIAEGFQQSIEKRGLIYKTLVGDGDSSVYQTVLDNDPYADYGIRVDKIECKNHLFRNFCSHIENASKAKFARRPSSWSVTALRERVSSSRVKMRWFVEAAGKRRNAENSTPAEKAEGLMRDILRMPGHFFGDHSQCDRDWEDVICDESETNIVEILREVQIFDIIEGIVQRLATNAESLLQNVTTNAAESYHAQGNRFNAGRRTNNSSRGSFYMRAHCAAMQQNTLALTSKLFESAGKRVPRVVLAMERSRRLQVARTKVHRQTNRRTRRRRCFGTDKDYGPSCRQPDLSQTKYDALAAKHFEKLTQRQTQREAIEDLTSSQSDSDLWHTYRRDMITASKFGDICRRKESTSCSRLVTDIRYPKVLEVSAVVAGKENEDAARKQLAQELGTEISLSGLFIDRDIPYLGASPDGLIDDDGIVEIKVLVKAAENNFTPEQAIIKIPAYKNFFARNSTGDMNRKHKHFYQVQGQLHITRREYCIFALWAPLGLKYIKVFRDDEFWENEMEPKLTRFYMECLLPEIVDSRQNRHMKIREPQYILQAQEREKAKKAEKQARKQVASAIVPPLESMEVDSEPVVDLSNRSNDARLESSIPCMASHDVEEELDQGMLVHVLQNISEEDVLANVLDVKDLLTDDSIEWFLDIVAKSCTYSIIPVLLFGYQSVLRASETKHDLLIIGGNQFRHWCCIRFEQTTLFVYDSLGRRTFEALREDERTFIGKRYPKVQRNKIVFPDVTRQPDNLSCGVYSAAFATALALDQDPSKLKYVRDARVMREHMARIIESRTLLPFPTEI